MSFVSIVFCNYFMSVVADSRGVEIYKDGRIHRVLSENEEKIEILSNKAFLAITGISNDARSFIEKSNLQALVLENGKLKEIDEIQKWFNNNKNYVVSVKSFTIDIGGLTMDNDFKVYTIDSEKVDLSILTCKDGDLRYSFSMSPFTNSDFCEKVFKELYQYYDGTTESMIRVQGLLNDIVADNDNSVNKNKKGFLILR